MSDIAPCKGPWNGLGGQGPQSFRENFFWACSGCSIPSSGWLVAWSVACPSREPRWMNSAADHWGIRGLAQKCEHGEQAELLGGNWIQHAFSCPESFAYAPLINKYRPSCQHPRRPEVNLDHLRCRLHAVYYSYRVSRQLLFSFCTFRKVSMEISQACFRVWAMWRRAYLRSSGPLGTTTTCVRQA